MIPFKSAVVACFVLGALATPTLAVDATNPDNCVADIGALDANGDGYVDNTEYASYGRVEMNVDTDGDGRISADERIVACREGALQALKPEN